MSESRLPARTWAMPAHMARSVVSISRLAASSTRPIGTVTAASPW
jgi:hypothetical protein